PSGVALAAAQADRPEELADRRADPPRPARSQLLPAGEAVTEEARPDPARRPVREWVPTDQREGRAVALEQADQERHEPAIAIAWRERQEPREPVEAHVVRRDLPRAPA